MPPNLPSVFFFSALILCAAALPQQQRPDAPERPPPAEAGAPDALRISVEVAREIDAGYVVTYKPLRPVGDAPPGEYRRLDVIARRLGLTLRARRGYVVKNK